MKRKIIRFLMSILPNRPEPSNMGLKEVFSHRSFLDANQTTQEKLLIQAAQWRYDYENSFPFEEIYFSTINLQKFLKNKVVLDLGCFTGGQSIAWAKRYGIKKIYGVDIGSAPIKAAHLFAQKLGVVSHFQVAFGEQLPFDDNFFDSIITYDTFEHVKNLKKVLKECWRVLKSNGVLICAFPQYLSPFEHHLGLVTKTPCIHWFFKGKDLITVYCELIEERGVDAYWYKRTPPVLEDWEKLNTINGTSIKQFRTMCKEIGWEAYFQSPIPLFKTGRLFNRHPSLKLLSKCFALFSRLPFLEEFCSERVACVLKKAG